MSEENVSCPYCGMLVPKHGMHEHLSFYCPAVLGKAQALIPPRGYEEGEVPEPAKSVIGRKGSLLTEARFEW